MRPQVPQRTQAPASIMCWDFLAPLMAFTGHAFAHAPQPMQASVIEYARMLTSANRGHEGDLIASPQTCALFGLASVHEDDAAFQIGTRHGCIRFNSMRLGKQEGIEVAYVLGFRIEFMEACIEPE